MSTAEDSKSAMRPTPATDLRKDGPGESKVQGAKKKLKRKRKMRLSNDGSTSAAASSSGDHVNANGDPEASEQPRRRLPPGGHQAKDTDTGSAHTLDESARTRTNGKEDAPPGRPSVDSARRKENKSFDGVGGDGGGRTAADDHEDDDDNQDEGVVIQRESTPKPTPTAVAMNKATAREGSKGSDKATASPSLSASPSVTTNDPGASELTSRSGKQGKTGKRRTVAQVDDDSDKTRSGIPFALPTPGAVAPACQCTTL